VFGDGSSAGPGWVLHSEASVSLALSSNGFFLKDTILVSTWIDAY
jgi:hypothetical protein